MISHGCRNGARLGLLFLPTPLTAPKTSSLLPCCRDSMSSHPQAATDGGHAVPPGGRGCGYAVQTAPAGERRCETAADSPRNGLPLSRAQRTRARPAGRAPAVGLLRGPFLARRAATSARPFGRRARRRLVNPHESGASLHSPPSRGPGRMVHFLGRLETGSPRLAGPGTNPQARGRPREAQGRESREDRGPATPPPPPRPPPRPQPLGGARVLTGAPGPAGARGRPGGERGGARGAGGGRGACAEPWRGSPGDAPVTSAAAGGISRPLPDARRDPAAEWARPTWKEGGGGPESRAPHSVGPSRAPGALHRGRGADKVLWVWVTSVARGPRARPPRPSPRSPHPRPHPHVVSPRPGRGC